MNLNNTILILDFGSQYNQLIARCVRENNVFCLVVPPNTAISEIKKIAPKGIILSGGPLSVYEKNAPGLNPEIYSLGIPILGICYGMQLLAKGLKGSVGSTRKREYGGSILTIDDKSDLFAGLPRKMVSWMSHGDYVKRMPKGFKKIAHTNNTRIAAFKDSKKKIFGVQFHPEVHHTQNGTKIISNFLFNIAGCKRTWTIRSFIEQSVENIRKEVKEEKVILGLSGGVDSSVAALLLHKAIKRKLVCIFVDNGLLRKGEALRVEKLFRKHYKMNLKVVKAKKLFLQKLKGVINPEKKRKIIGRTFIKVFEKEAKKLGQVSFLAQGTLYPDLIESRSAFGGPSAIIKTHHNVGGLPKKMGLRLIEPLKYLFKDEVRELGKKMNMPDELVWRQPFPGPGLAVRIIGEVTEERLSILKNADWIIVDEAKKHKLYYKTWQCFGVLLPIKTVGIMGDQRTYENVVAIRAVTSRDGMTADWAKLPYAFLEKVSNKIVNEVKGVNRVVYDTSSKPPATIEWE
ncbi:MAG: glutamine-hydrolyzing GMP synthase [Candidatus Omnitrophota bacterium]